MALSNPKLTWCNVRLDENYSWWVNETSDPVRWDVDALSILDPRQLAHVLDLCDQLKDYGFDPDFLENSFFSFRIQEDLGKGRVKLKRWREGIVDSEEALFVLPDVIDDEKGPYADFLDHITLLRVKLLNDLIDFAQHITVEEIEEEIRDTQAAKYMEGRAVHVFEELCSILEFVPEGYELDSDSDLLAGEDGEEDDASALDAFPEIEEVEDEDIETDETMQWDEDEEDEDEEEDLEEFEDEEEDDRY